MAHGYLISILFTNIKFENDKYKFNDFKFPLEIYEQINKIRPKNKIIGARVTGTDHLKNGIKIKDASNLINKLKT